MKKKRKKQKKKINPYRNRIYISIILIIILFLIFFLLEKQIVYSCNYEFENVFVDVASSQWEYATALPVDITLKIENPSPLPKYLIKMNYELYANNELLNRGVFSENIKISANGREEIRTTMFLDFNDFSEELLDAIAQDEAEYKIKIKPFFDSFLGRVSYERVVEKED